MEEKSLSMEIIEELMKRDKTKNAIINKLFIGWVITSCVALMAMLSMHMSTLNFMSQYEYSTQTVEVKTDGDSSAYYQNGKGNTINGSENKSGDEKDGKEKTKEN